MKKIILSVFLIVSLLTVFCSCATTGDSASSQYAEEEIKVLTAEELREVVDKALDNNLKISEKTKTQQAAEPVETVETAEEKPVEEKAVVTQEIVIPTAPLEEKKEKDIGAEIAKKLNEQKNEAKTAVEQVGGNKSAEQSAEKAVVETKSVIEQVSEAGAAKMEVAEAAVEKSNETEVVAAAEEAKAEAEVAVEPESESVPVLTIIKKRETKPEEQVTPVITVVKKDEAEVSQTPVVQPEPVSEEKANSGLIIGIAVGTAFVAGICYIIFTKRKENL